MLKYKKLNQRTDKVIKYGSSILLKIFLVYHLLNGSRVSFSLVIIHFIHYNIFLKFILIFFKNKNQLFC